MKVYDMTLSKFYLKDTLGGCRSNLIRELRLGYIVSFSSILLNQHYLKAPPRILRKSWPLAGLFLDLLSSLPQIILSQSHLLRHLRVPKTHRWYHHATTTRWRSFWQDRERERNGRVGRTWRILKVSAERRGPHVRKTHSGDWQDVIFHEPLLGKLTPHRASQSDICCTVI